jgi:hypothetical protein
MDIILLCQTQKKDSYQESGLKFNKEYAIGQNLTDEEKEKFRCMGITGIIGFYNPIITMSRRVDYRGEISTPWEWNFFWDAFSTIEKSIESFGDSDFWRNSESLHPLYTQAIEKYNMYCQLSQELEKTKQEKESLKNKYNSLYDSELKAKKIYSKAKQGIAPQNLIDEIRGKFTAEYQKELIEINKKIEDLYERILSLA